MSTEIKPENSPRSLYEYHIYTDWRLHAERHGQFDVYNFAFGLLTEEATAIQKRLQKSGNNLLTLSLEDREILTDAQIARSSKARLVGELEVDSPLDYRSREDSFIETYQDTGHSNQQFSDEEGLRVDPLVRVMKRKIQSLGSDLNYQKGDSGTWGKTYDLLKIHSDYLTFMRKHFISYSEQHEDQSTEQRRARILTEAKIADEKSYKVAAKRLLGVSEDQIARENFEDADMALSGKAEKDEDLFLEFCPTPWDEIETVKAVPIFTSWGSTSLNAVVEEPLVIKEEPKEERRKGCLPTFFVPKPKSTEGMKLAELPIKPTSVTKEASSGRGRRRLGCLPIALLPLALLAVALIPRCTIPREGNTFPILLDNGQQSVLGGHPVDLDSIPRVIWKLDGQNFNGFMQHQIARSSNEVIESTRDIKADDLTLLEQVAKDEEDPNLATSLKYQFLRELRELNVGQPLFDGDDMGEKSIEDFGVLILKGDIVVPPDMKAFFQQARTKYQNTNTSVQ